jgi:ABC-type bacteriocin/lantibiotic exporter with double-glycine peptidase domain
MRLEAVGKRYGLRQPWVVRDVSLDVAGGRLIRVEGPNGSGKSTLLTRCSGGCWRGTGFTWPGSGNRDRAAAV